MQRMWLMVGLLFAGSLASAQVNNYYVSPTGNDANAEANVRNSGGAVAWRTLGHADTAFLLGANGTTINVASCPTSAACYTGNISLGRSGSPTQPLIYRSTVKWGAHVDGYVELYGQFETFQNFDVENTGCCGQNTDDGIVNYLNSTNGPFGSFNNILGNHVHNVEFATTFICGGTLRGNSGIEVIGKAHDIFIDGNVVDHNGHWGGCPSSGSGSHGIYVGG